MNSVRMLNFFPTKGGISATLSPKTIMSREVLDYKKHLRLQIGQHCQVHEEETPRNRQIARTKGTICSLGPSGNLQGGYKFMALDTGKKITRRNWDVIPMPDLVIARVNALGKDQPVLFTFTDQHGRLVGDAEEAAVPDNIETPDDVEFPGVNHGISNNVEIPGVDYEEEGPPSQSSYTRN
jgi:hypothetical protein